MKQLLLLIIAVLFVYAPLTAQEQPERVYIVNQGAFLQGNASITSYNPETGDVQQNIFEAVNGRPLGDVALHSALINDLLFIVVGNSDKIEIVDPLSFESVETIFVDDFGGSSPQWIEQVSETKAYISNLLLDTISILDLETLEITGSITVGANPEGITVSEGKAYIAITEFGEGNQIAVVDIATDELLKTITAHDNPRFLLTDNDGFVWVMCTGNFGFGDADESFGEIVVIDPATDEVVERIEVGGKPQNLRLNNNTRRAYVVNEGVQLVDMDTFELQENLLFETAYFALGVWGTAETTYYATFAPDFSSAGRVDIRTADGEITGTFSTGIGPGYVQFTGDSEPPVSVQPGENPSRMQLMQNYPNPFNPTTRIRFELAESMDVRLEVFSVLGQRVAVLANGSHTAGAHSVGFDAAGLSSGMYLYRLTAGSETITRSMMLVK
ncbi:MAG: T9SS type A sorting domain-containing protein [Balneolales bacterium]|nr:T9SS type A sorting domain-containing protein [Balneolales bacterium]